jgi:ABC-type multidrug transport system fused ATPase/permease subunit
MPSSARGWSEARELLWEHRHRLLLGFALLLLSRLAGFVLPASSKYLLDEVIGKHRGELLVPLALAVIAGTVVQALTAFALAQVLGVSAQRSIMEARRTLERRVMRLPIRYFDSQKTGVLISRIMSDAEGVRNLLGTGLVQLASSLLTALMALAALLYLNWRLTSMTLVMMGGFGIIVAMAFQRLRPIQRQRAELGAQLTGRLAEALSGVRVVKAYTAEKHEELAFTKGLHRLFRTVGREITMSSLVGAAAIVIFGLIGASMMLVGGRSILAGHMTVGDFVMYVFLIGLLIAPVVRIADTTTQLSEALIGLERMRQIRKLPTEDEEDRGRASLPSTRGEVEFEDVGFEYASGEPVLKNISFRAACGTTTALVGPSGAGKSTLIGLVMGFHRPTSGRILVDGADLDTIRVRDFRTHLGVVLQDNFLFNGTIAENIAYARPRASHEEVLAAAALAHCDEFAERFPEKYDTVVGERGAKLSGGQRQRVAIARAILADPRILILDEATSSLDSDSEAMIQDGLRSLRTGRTTFVIAHRLSTIRSADQILVIEGGTIVERGVHDSLVARNGKYRHLYDKQQWATNDQFVNPGEDITVGPAEASAAVPAAGTEAEAYDVVGAFDPSTPLKKAPHP